ncbi:HPF/RaiA family ribosome-associated protein [Bacteroidota bacterium]
MIIQFNTDNNINSSEILRKPLINLISEALSRFGKQITRVGVHLSDEDGNKDGLNDKRCMLEARQPIAVTNHADNHEQAVSGAIDKLKTSLDTIFERLRNH